MKWTLLVPCPSSLATHYSCVCYIDDFPLLAHKKVCAWSRPEVHRNLPGAASNHWQEEVGGEIPHLSRLLEGELLWAAFYTVLHRSLMGWNSSCPDITCSSKHLILVAFPSLSYSSFSTNTSWGHTSPQWNIYTRILISVSIVLENLTWKEGLQVAELIGGKSEQCSQDRKTATKISNHKFTL